MPFPKPWTTGGRQIVRVDGKRVVLDARRYDFLGTIVIDQEPGEGQMKATTTPEGFLRVEGKISRTGVLAYSDADGNTWREFRSPEEVFSKEAMDSFRLVVMTEGHPAEMVTLDNVDDVLVGHGGEPRAEEDKFVATTFLITNADAIRSAKDATAVELSAGYRSDVLLEGGVSPDGEEFDARQTKIRGNHVAKVDQGRCGPECRLLMRGDAIQSTNNNPRGDDMKITINGKEIEIPEDSDLAKALMELTAGEGGEEGAATAEGDEGGTEGTAPAAAPAPATEPEEGKTVKVTTTKTIQNQGDSALQAKVDAQTERIKQLEETREARIDERVELVAKAQIVIPPKKDKQGKETPYDHRGKTDAQIMRDVVLEIAPGRKDRLDAYKDDMGYLRASYEDALEEFEKRVDSSDELQRVTHMAHRGAPRTSTSDLDEAFAKHCDSLNGEEPEGDAAAGEGK